MNVCPKIEYLDCSGNLLTELVVDKLINLKSLICSNNMLSGENFVMPANANLNTFEAANALNGVKELDLRSMTNLQKLDVSHNASLERLLLYYLLTNLQYLYAHDCPALSTIAHDSDDTGYAIRLMKLNYSNSVYTGTFI